MCRGNSLVMIISISVHSSPDAIRGCSFTIHCGSFCKVTSSLCFFCVTLPAIVLHPFMYLSFVLTKTTLWSCLMVTLPARVIHLFMNWCFVSIKITLCSCLMVTFSTSTSCTLWSHELIFVLSKMTRWSCLMVTLCARFLQPFICCFFVSSKTTLLSCLMVTLCFFVLSKTIVPDSSPFHEFLS